MYDYQVAAASYQIANGTLNVEPDVVPLTVPVDLVYYPFEYEWTVEPVTITDGYSVTLKMTYDTKSPQPTLYIWGKEWDRAPDWAGGPITQTFYYYNPAIITQTVVSIGGVPVNDELGPQQPGSVILHSVPSKCGLNKPTTVVSYQQAVGGPTYTFNPSSLTSQPLTPTLQYGHYFDLEVVQGWDGIRVDVGQPAELDWITMTLASWAQGSLYLYPGTQIPLTMTAQVPAFLAEGVYTDVIPIRLFSGGEVIKESFVNIVATQTPYGLEIHTAFDPGDLVYETATYTTHGLFGVACHRHDWGVAGDSNGIVLRRLAPFGFGAPSLPFKPSTPVFGYGNQQVKIEIDQDVMLEREAFQATLVMTNNAASAVEGIFSQRLVRRTCPDCRELTTYDKRLLETIE
jgi:hypothetical protein